MHTPSPESKVQVMSPVIRSCDLDHTSEWAIKNPALRRGECSVGRLDQAASNQAMGLFRRKNCYSVFYHV